MLRARRGGPADIDQLAALMFAAPSREAIAIAGTAEAARRFLTRLWRHALEAGTSTVIVAEDESGTVGFAQVSHGGEIPPFPTVARAALASMGLGAIGAGWRSLARMKVDLSPPPGGVHLVELQVAPELRNRGIGAFLLARVEEHALEHGAAHVSLTTAADNPARRLYERNGYELVAQKTDARYERITGSEGRVLMVKRLDLA